MHFVTFIIFTHAAADFKNDYKSLYPWYMESIWWVFQQLFTKGLVYQGVKVMPYSTACTTALSNFESGQNYKDVVDPSVVVAFPLRNYVDATSLLAWTTTPWTLPSNLALCVNATLEYVKIRDTDTQRLYILARCRLEHIFKDASKYEVLESLLGQDLRDLEYEPMFDYFADTARQQLRAFRVLCDDYVDSNSGTGVVHQAPYFGEEDYGVCLRNGVIGKETTVICPVDAVGRFVDPVADFRGQYVKDADKAIIAHIKARGRLLQVGQVRHSYPFCWRSDTPLLYKAVPSWFVRVEQMSAALLESNSHTYWVPDFVKEKRFGNWLRDARDWSVSRNRYWGTPMPLWTSEDGVEVVCIGSIAELQRYTGVLVTDLHRESIDHLTIPSKRAGHPPLRRVTEVFDCWFESGAMPYAQQHYPFDNAAEFEQRFPADFIAEGIDQTRGWFYTLLVLSTALFGKAPFKNVIANGLVLATDGQKMSKSKRNYPDPSGVIDQYGADALRLYLINSPVVRAENLRFKEEGVRDVVKDVLLPWYNAYRFLFQNITRYVQEEHTEYTFDRQRYLANRGSSVMDIWITSFKESLLEFVAAEMKAYRLYTVVPRLTKFIDQLTNWYVRLNRRRIKGDFGRDQCIASLDTLFDVLDAMVKMMAPFTPFIAEYMFQRLVQLNEHPLPGSVHYQMMPVCDRAHVRDDVELSVQRMQTVIELGRVLRDRNTMPTKYPVPEVVVIHKTDAYLQDVRQLEDFVLGELNARKLTVCADKERYGVQMRAEPDHKVLGVRLKSTFKAVLAAVKALSDADIQAALRAGYYQIGAERIELDEVRIIYHLEQSAAVDGVRYEAHSDNDVLVLMDLRPSQEMIEEGMAREIINRVQKMKKKAKLVPTDAVHITYEALEYRNADEASGRTENCIWRVLREQHGFIQTTIKSPLAEHDTKLYAGKRLLLSEQFEMKELLLQLNIYTEEELLLPTVDWVNVMWHDRKAYAEGTVLLVDRSGQRLTLAGLHREVDTLFGLSGRRIVLSLDDVPLSDDAQLGADARLSGRTLVATGAYAESSTGQVQVVARTQPYAQFVNAEHGGRRVTWIVENPLGAQLDGGDAQFVAKRLAAEFPGVPTAQISVKSSRD